MLAGKLQVLAPDKRRRHDDMFDLICKVFAHGDYFGFRDYCRRVYIDHSHYDWSASRIGILDGRIVTHSGVQGYTMRVGTARLKVGGIGVVAMHGDYRRRGLMARTANASIEAMHELGYDMSVLFGIPDFYHRFGHVRAWANTDHSVEVEDLPKERPRLQPRRFAVRHRDDLAELYNGQNATATGTAVRPTFLGNRHPGDWRGLLWAGPGGARPATRSPAGKGARCTASRPWAMSSRCCAPLRGWPDASPAARSASVRRPTTANCASGCAGGSAEWTSSIAAAEGP